MRALVLSDGIREEIGRVIAHARENPVSLARMEAVMEGKAPPVGEDPAFACAIPVDYRAVFSIEEHPGGWMRHLSVSIPGGRLPHPSAVEMILEAFGFSGGLEDCERWVEDLEEGRALNLVQRLEAKEDDRTADKAD